MTIAFATWLEHHRPVLLAHWAEALAPLVPAAYAGNGGGSDYSGAAHPDERAVLLASLFEGLVGATRGDQRLLDEYVCLARALRTNDGEDELQEQLALLFGFRQVAWQILCEVGTPPDQIRDLGSALGTLIDEAALSLTSHWTTSANNVARQLRQTEQLAASLHEAIELSDRMTLQLSDLNEIGRSLATRLDTDYVIETIGGKLADALGVAQVVICLSDGEGGLRVARSWGEAALPAGAAVVGGDGDVLMRAFQLGEVVVDHSPDPDHQGPWYQPECAVLAAPMLAHDKPTGVIVLQQLVADAPFQHEQQRFLSSVASQAAIALENARLYNEVRGFNAVLEQRITERTRELQTERDILETLHQISLEVSSTLDIDLLLQTCLEVLAKLAGVSDGAVMLIERETDHLVDRAVLGPGERPGYRRCPVGHGVLGWVAQHKKAALIDDLTCDPRWAPLPSADPDAASGGSLLAVPLVAHHDTMGVLLLSHPETGYFNEGHQRLLSAVAGSIALGVYNALLYDQIQQELLRQGERLRNERRSTAQSYAILQSLSDGVIVCNAEGNVLAANPAAARILDRDVEELLTWHLPDLFNLLLGQRRDEMPIANVLDRPHDTYGRTRHTTATFQIGRRVVSITLDPVVSTNDEVLGAVTVFRDITREVESDRLKDEFIGTVSHELRTPMTSIKGYTQLMAMGSLGPLNDTQKEFLSTIHTNAERMITIINDLLDITKIETGSVVSELDQRPVHLAEALSTVILDLQARIEAREQELSLSVPLGLPMVRVDARRFNQILVNLVTNAIKYTPRCGKIIIEASDVTDSVVPETLREGLKPGHYVRVDIRDTGVGIPLDEQERIFERFYRTENPLKIEAGGTGLGLALVRPLVRLFGGRIWLDSVPGEGTTFSLVIPVLS